MNSLRVDPAARNVDEWPNLDAVDRPLLPDGDHLEHHEPVSHLRIILALVFILGALTVKHCAPRGLDETDQAVVLVD